jgi:hypothetical protein
MSWTTDLSDLVLIHSRTDAVDHQNSDRLVLYMDSTGKLVTKKITSSSDADDGY